MARVNRSTGIFLILGVAALLGTVAGARFMMGPDDKAPDVPLAPSTDVFCTGDTDTMSGLLMPVPSTIGKVKAINFKDGDSVKAGQVIVQLDDQTARDQLAVARKELEAAKSRLAHAKAENQIEIKIIEQENLVSRASATYKAADNYYREAQKSNEAGVRGAKTALDNAEIAVKQSKQDVDAAKEVLAKLKSIDRKVALKEFEDELAAQELKVKALDKALENYVIQAPADGKIVEINYQIGGPCPLPMGDNYATRALVILPNEPLVVRAEVDQERALMVNVGQRATITFRAAAGRDYKWTGKVEKAAEYMQKRRSRSIEPDQFVNTRTRECIIRIDPDPKNPVMLQGTRVSVQIHTE
jgi:multidrug resistance efflux pump